MTHHGFKDLAGRSGRAASRMADEAATGASSVYDLAGEIAQSAIDQARSSASDVHDYYRRGNRAVARQIASQSIPTLLLVAGVSFALGWFAREIQQDMKED